MRTPTPSRPFERAGVALRFLLRRCSQGPGGVHAQDESLGGDILAQVAGRHPQHRSAPRAQTWPLRTTPGPKWTCGFGKPLPPQREPGLQSTYLAWPPKAGHLGHSPDSREKAFPSRGRANPRPSLGESFGRSLPKSNVETLWANHQQQRGEGRVKAPPPSLRRPRNLSAKIPRAQSAAEQRRGACPPGPLPSALRPPPP